jgi:hypothetical protein
LNYSVVYPETVQFLSAITYNYLLFLQNQQVNDPSK